MLSRILSALVLGLVLSVGASWAVAHCGNCETDKKQATVACADCAADKKEGTAACAQCTAEKQCDACKAKTPPATQPAPKPEKVG